MPSGDSPGMSPQQRRRGSVASPRRFADHGEVGKRQSDERRAQHRQPGHAVERRLQRARQRLQVAHHRHIGQRFEIHADERHAARSPSAARIARRCGRAPASTAMVSPGRVRTSSAIRSAAAFGLGSRGPQSPSTRYRCAVRLRDRCARRRWPGAARRCVRTSSASGNTRANTSLHQCTSAGAERKLRRSSSGVQSAVAPRPARAHRREAAHLGVAKSVDGLHRIADQEQRAAVAVRPVLRERPQQVVLVARGVLEFVDEDVHEPRAEPFGQRRRAAVLGERPARGAGDLGVIAFAVQVEHARQLRRGEQQ